MLSSLSLSVLAPCPLQQEPSNGDLSPDTLLFLQTQRKEALRIFVTQVRESRQLQGHVTAARQQSILERKGDSLIDVPLTV